MNFNELPDGFYTVKQTDSPDPERNWSLVRLYYNHDSKTRGIGFGIWDGPGFVPLSDLSETTVLTPVRLAEKSDFDEMIDRVKSVLPTIRHDSWPSGLCTNSCPGCVLERGILKLITEQVEGADQLHQMFDMQQQLNKRCGVDTTAMTGAEKSQWVLNYTRALSQETAELVDSVPWKWWAKYQQFDEQNARVEVVDMFHFLISLAQVLGMSAEDVFRVYSEKNKVNHQRQDSGYAVKTDDNKAIA